MVGGDTRELSQLRPLSTPEAPERPLINMETLDIDWGDLSGLLSMSDRPVPKIAFGKLLTHGRFISRPPRAEEPAPEIDQLVQSRVGDALDLDDSTAKVDASATQENERKLKRDGLWFKVHVGIIGVIGAISVPLFLAETDSPDRPSFAAASPSPAIADPVNTGESPDTSSSLPTTTTELPPPTLYEAKIGDVIGVLKIPALCEEVQVVAYNEQERAQALIGQGSAVLDIKNPDPSKTENCDIADEREQAFEQSDKEFIRRAERIRPGSGVGPGNPSGQVNFWQPIAGFEMSANNRATSFFPGQPGNAVISGHGSTFSAPFADLGLLKTGDPLHFIRSDGRHLAYKIVATEVVNNDNLIPIYNYSHPDNASTLTIYMCSDAEGRTGSSAKRYVVRAVLQ